MHGVGRPFIGVSVRLPRSDATKAHRVLADPAAAYVLAAEGVAPRTWAAVMCCPRRPARRPALAAHVMPVSFWWWQVGNDTPTAVGARHVVRCGDRRRELPAARTRSCWGRAGLQVESRSSTSPRRGARTKTLSHYFQSSVVATLERLQCWSPMLAGGRRALAVCASTPLGAWRAAVARARCRAASTCVAECSPPPDPPDRPRRLPIRLSCAQPCRGCCATARQCAGRLARDRNGVELRLAGSCGWPQRARLARGQACRVAQAITLVHGALRALRLATSVTTAGGPRRSLFSG